MEEGPAINHFGPPNVRLQLQALGYYSTCTTELMGIFNGLERMTPRTLVLVLGRKRPLWVTALTVGS
jgi:hypothetical protein